MRIIGGTLKGRRIKVPSNFRSRPTTDMAREALFNILQNYVDFEELYVLDLFGGTGSISYEFASRNCKLCDIVEKDRVHADFILKTAALMNITQIIVHHSDVFKFLYRCHKQYNMIFADPPYAMENLKDIPSIIFKQNIIENDGIVILEHSDKHNFSDHEHFFQERKYGGVHFSFFSY